MKSNATTPEEYISALPEERRGPFSKLREGILQRIPKGFEEKISYGMISYVVPFSLYPEGYHANPKEPLGCLSIASQKNYIALYYMGFYSDTKLLEWFIQEFPKHSQTKLDMGKCCVRFKKIDQIPYQLIGELCSKMTPSQCIDYDRKALSRNKF